MSEHEYRIRTIYGPIGQKGYSVINPAKPEDGVLEVYLWPKEMERMKEELGIDTTELPSLKGRPSEAVTIQGSKPPPPPKRADLKIKGRKIS